jgi:hypothetical protein
MDNTLKNNTKATILAKSNVAKGAQMKVITFKNNPAQHLTLQVTNNSKK